MSRETGRYEYPDSVAPEMPLHPYIPMRNRNVR